MPADQGGVYVDFGVKTAVHGATVIFVDAAGKRLPAGTPGKIEDAGDSFLVGYDGRAYITKLAASNVARITTGLSECVARFDYLPTGKAQPTIGPIACQ